MRFFFKAILLKKIMSVRDTEYDLRDPQLYLDPAYAKSYGSSGENPWTELCRRLVREAKLRPNDIVADLGCGTGYTTREIVAHGVQKIYAIDPSPAMLSEGAKNFVGVEVIEGTLETLVASQREKPTVFIASGVFVVLEDSEETVSKIYQYLGKGGRLSFTVEDWSVAHIDDTPKEEFFREVNHFLEARGYQPECPNVVDRKISPEDVIAMIAKRGGRLELRRTSEMAWPAENMFTSTYGREIAILDTEIFQCRQALTKKSFGSGFNYARKRLPELLKRRETLENVKTLYQGKRWVDLEQHVFHTVVV